MDAYILGNHEGDLPTHLLSQGEPGNRIRAMAKLDGPDHNVFYAIEAPDDASLEDHTSTITTSGTQPGLSMTACVTVTCVGQRGKGHPNPSFLPLELAEIVLHWLEAEEAAEAVAAAAATLGEDNVAVATDGQNGFLIELGSNDPATLKQVSDDLVAALGGSGSSGHTVTGGILKM